MRPGDGGADGGCIAVSTTASSDTECPARRRTSEERRTCGECSGKRGSSMTERICGHQEYRQAVDLGRLTEDAGLMGAKFVQDEINTLTVTLESRRPPTEA